MKALNLNCRPSEMIGIEDTYTAFCFDEACALIVTKLEKGEEPCLMKTEVSGGPSPGKSKAGGALTFAREFT